MPLCPRLSRCEIKSPAGQEGYVLPMVLVWSFLILVEMGGLASYVATTARQVRIQKDRVQAFYFAEAAAQSAGAQVRMFIQANGRSPSDAELQQIAQRRPFFGSRFQYSTFSVAYDGAASQIEALTAGNYAGLNGTHRELEISSGIRPAVNLPAVTLNQAYEIQAIPVFQFGVFYQNDLEILPGANMSFLGSVHTNRDLYMGVGSGNTAALTFDSTITSAGNIYHQRKDGSSIGGGAVNIMDDQGDYQPMFLDNEWLDSRSSDWVTESQTRWGGNVKTVDHGAQALNLPLSSGVPPHDIIERRSVSDSAELRDQKLDYKAKLRIIDGQALNEAGQTVELRYCTNNGTLQANGTCSRGVLVQPLSTTTFYDSREQKTIQTTEIDVSKLNDSPSFSQIVNANNGVVVYFSDRRAVAANAKNGVRLVNGSTLPQRGVTFASENPMYVKGHYNSTAKKPAGLVSDSLTLLSGNWSDANSSSNLSNRVASDTTVNAAVLTGNVETSGAQYSGGFENIHRFLENWSNRTLTYKGSVEVMYASESGTGTWGKSNVYSPPNRNWSFDTDFLDDNNAIPGFPSVYNVARGIWSRD